MVVVVMGTTIDVDVGGHYYTDRQLYIKANSLFASYKSKYEPVQVFILIWVPQRCKIFRNRFRMASKWGPYLARPRNKPYVADVLL